MDLLRRDGPNIVDQAGQPVRLRGACLGGWMLMENFITGFPGTEGQLRAALHEVLGAAKAEFLIERFLDYFIGEEDIRYLATLGANVVRVPMNCRHFEPENAPFSYKQAGFTRLDRLLGWCKRYGVYAILDLHAAHGWQNPDWHSDNAHGAVLLYHNPQYQARLVRLWQALAARYEGNPVVAGYNLLNEPATPDGAALRDLYLKLASAVRDVDKGHLLFFDGNHYATSFSELGAPFDAQMVVASHNYVMHWALQTGGEARYSADALREFVLRSDGYQYADQYGLPQWCGEFGGFFHLPEEAEFNRRLFRDECALFNETRRHWTFWTYKDLGVMGLVSPAAESLWMRRTAATRKAKEVLGCDSWFDLHGRARLAHWKKQIGADVEQALAGSGLKPDSAARRAFDKSLDGTVSAFLTRAFAEQFKDLDESGLDELAASFKFEKCVRSAPLEEIIRSAARQ